MTERVLGPTGSPRRRWTLLLPLIAVLALGLVYITGAQSAPPQSAGHLELDKNLTDDLTVSLLGTLKSQINSTASPLTFDVCERTPVFPSPFDPAPPLANGTHILIDAEEMVITGSGTASDKTGGCSFINPADTVLDVRSYTVTRAAPATHPGGADVSTLTPGSRPGTDWDEVEDEFSANSTDDNPCAAISGSVACTFLDDPPGQSMFTQGSSDTADIPGWTHTDSSVPDADEILHAYAIKFSSDFLYFGADRFATNGAKDMGFWFFKTPVHAAANGKFVDDEGNPAVHQVGDILLLGTFTQGGAITTIRVFKWVGTGGSDGSLDEGGSFGDCVPGGNNDGCDTVNNTTVPSPWAYQGKGSTAAANVVYSGGMMEGGIDLGALDLEGCFASFMAETRSAPSLTAAQKDFTLGRFESCGADVVTTPKAGDGTDVPGGTSPGLQLGTGATGVTAQDSALLTVTGTTTFTGQLKFFICGPIAIAATCETGGVPAGTTNVTQNGTYPSAVVKLTEAANNTTGAPGHYCWRAEFSSTTPGLTAGAKDSSATECFVVKPVTPALSTTAVDCTASHAVLPVPIDFPGPFCDKAVLGDTANKKATNGGVSGTYTSILTGSPLPASNGGVATGTITFTLFGPDAVSQTGCPAETVEATGTNPQTVNVSGNNSYFTTAVTVSSPGKYHWKASYTGDNPNTLGTSHNDACDQAAEDVTVRHIPSAISTRQRVYPNDSARIDSSDASVNLPANGEVTFRFYVAGGGNTAFVNCQAHGTTLQSGGLQYVETKTLTGGSASETVATNNTSYPLTSLTSAGYWWVTYDPKSSAFTGRQSDCIENTSVTFVDHGGPGTVFTPAP